MKLSEIHRYDDGRIWFRTATVGDMIDYLLTLDRELPVYAAWEGQEVGVSLRSLKEDALILDVEQNVTAEDDGFDWVTQPRKEVYPKNR